MTERIARLSLTFACELDAARLTSLFENGSVIDDLRALGARVMIMVSDLSSERAGVVRQLNQAGIPVVGIPLFPWEEGYYFTVDNAPQATKRYEQWKQWTAEHGLVWDWVGLDLEPEARVYQELMTNPWGLVPMLLPLLRDQERVRRAREAYGALVDQIHADGWQVENYQFPLIADERRVGSTLPADRCAPPLCPRPHHRGDSRWSPRRHRRRPPGCRHGGPRSGSATQPPG